MIYIAGHAISIRKQLQRINSVAELAKPWIDSAVEASPEASVAWSVICLALPLLSKPMKAETASTDGFTYVSSRMRFYISMETLLLQKSPSTGSSKYEEEFKQHILELYNNILKYQIYCIIRFHINTAKTIFDDVRSSVDWEAMRKKIEDQEKLIVEESQLIRVNESGIALQKSRKTLEDLRSDAEQMNAAMQKLCSLAREQNNLLQRMYDRTLSNDEAKCLQVFSRTPSYEKYKQQIPRRIDGTCAWFLSQPAYKDWYIKREGILLVTADPGCGKSVLAKHIVDVELANISGTNVCYFFFKDQYQDILSEALCALIHQLFNKDKDLLKYGIPHFNSRGNKLADNEEALMEILDDAVLDEDRLPIIFVMDALDECEASGSTRLFQYLEDLQNKPKKVSCKFFLTGRPYDRIIFNFKTLESHSNIHIPGNNESETIAQEVKLVIKQRVQKLCRIGRLKADLQEDLEKALVSKQSRTYLWVRLIFEELEKGRPKTTRRELEKFLSTLPISVNAAYEQILGRSTDDDDEARTMAYQTFCVLLSAAKPWSIRQIQCAAKMRLSPRLQSHEELDIEEDEDFADKLRNCCGLLIQIQGNQVNFLHQTGREFLMFKSATPYSSQESASTWGGSISIAQANNTIAQVCVNYLTLSDFDDGLRMEHENYPLLSYAANFWEVHFKQGAFNIKDEFLIDVRTLCTGNYFETWTDLRRSAGPKLSGVVPVGCWIPSLLFLEFSATQMDSKKFVDSCQSSLLTAVRMANTEITRFLLEHGANANISQPGTQAALEIAMRWGRPGMVQLLLEHNADPNILCTGGITVFEIAKDDNNSVALTKLLLECGANPYVTNKWGVSAVEIAIEHGFKPSDIVLLEHQLTHRYQFSNDDDVFHLLCIALGCNNLTIFQKVIDTIGPLNTQLSKSGNLLGRAYPIYPRYTVQLGILEVDHMVLGRLIMKLWHKNKANTPWSSLDFWTLCKIAIDHPEFIPLVLERSFEVNKQDDDGYAALHLAIMEDCHCPPSGISWGFRSSENRAFQIVYYTLLNNGADCNLQAKTGMAPLHLVTIFRDYDVLNFLLECGANINVMDIEGRTPLHSAVDISAPYNWTANHPTMSRDISRLGSQSTPIQTLLKNGAEPNMQDSSGATALMIAARQGSIEIVKMLLESGANPSTKNKVGETARDLAIIHGHSAITALLSTLDEQTRSQQGSQGLQTPETDD